MKTTIIVLAIYLLIGFIVSTYVSRRLRLNKFKKRLENESDKVQRLAEKYQSSVFSVIGILVAVLWVPIILAGIIYGFVVAHEEEYDDEEKEDCKEEKEGGED